MNASSIDTESFQVVHFDLHGGEDLLKDFVTLATHEEVINKLRLNKTAPSEAEGMITQVIGRYLDISWQGNVKDSFFKLKT